MRPRRAPRRAPSRTAGHLDANASRPVSPRAWAAFVRAQRLVAAQPWPAGARRLLAHAARVVARCLAASPGELVWTGGGTEANAWALDVAMARAVAGWRSSSAPEVLVSAIEHPAVAEGARHRARAHGLTVRTVAPGVDGQVTAEAFAGAMGPHTRVCALMAAHNETGVVQPLAEAVAACRARAGALGIVAPHWHADAVQAAPCLPLAPIVRAVDSIAFAGHKLGGVGGIGCAWMRGGARPAAWHDGGVDDEISQPAAWALAVALAAVPSEAPRLRALAAARDALEAALSRLDLGITFVGADAPRLPHTSSFRLPGCPADGLMMALDVAGFCTSTGSACASGAIAASPSLLAMGMDAGAAREVIRLSLVAPMGPRTRRRLVAEVGACARRAAVSPSLCEPQRWH